ncbi:MAG: NrdH-redoxin [Candidatus Heimdallarchaeota archaeon]|nr:NrdH-redoxin [Candidatus Heimdallarchaeota archaeon]
MIEIEVIYGTEWCGDCVRSKKLLKENKIPCKWIDIDSDEEAKKRAAELNGGKWRVPTIVFSDGSILIEPSDEELGRKLEL